jgi:divalent metal cation (Fe/Co/Zn/Cd) transporter
VILVPIVTGIPAGIAYGLYRKRRDQALWSRIKFCFTFWASTLIIFLAVEAFLFTLPDLDNIIAAALSLLVFAAIWTYLMGVIYDNPLTFDHLMPEDWREAKVSPESSGTSALIRKRRD